MEKWRMDVERKTKIMRIKGPELVSLAARHMGPLSLSRQELGVFSLENQKAS